MELVIAAHGVNLLYSKIFLANFKRDQIPSPVLNIYYLIANKSEVSGGDWGGGGGRCDRGKEQSFRPNCERTP